MAVAQRMTVQDYERFVMTGVEGAKPGEPTGSEDCLYLNVYAPRLAAAEVPQAERRLPVMLWIHGGGNTIGEAAFYDGGKWKVEDKR